MPINGDSDFSPHLTPSAEMRTIPVLYRNYLAGDPNADGVEDILTDDNWILPYHGGEFDSRTNSVFSTTTTFFLTRQVGHPFSSGYTFGPYDMEPLAGRAWDWEGSQTGTLEFEPAARFYVDETLA